MEGVREFDKKVFIRIGIALSAFIIVNFAIQALLMTIVASINPNIDTQHYMWLSMIVIYGIGLPVFYLIVKSIPTFTETAICCYDGDTAVQEHMEIGPKKFLGYLAVCVTGMYIFNIVGMVINIIIGKMIGREILNPLENILSNASMVLIFIFTVILAPIFEELIFRKIILDRVKIYGDKFAIFFTAIIFGLFHGNLSQFFYATALGVIFAYITLRTGRLIYSILLHMIINFMGGFLAIKIFEIIGRAVEGQVLSINQMILMGIFPIVMLTLFISGIVVFFVNKKNILLEGPKVEATSSEISKIAYINIGFILFLILSLIQFIVVIFGISMT